MRITIAIAVACLALTGLTVASESDASIKQYELNIPRQTLDAALKDLAAQTGLQIARFSDAIKGDTVVGPLTGRYTAALALEALLEPNGLTYRPLNDRGYIVLTPADVAKLPLSSKEEEPRQRESSLSTSEGQGLRVAEGEKAPSPSSGDERGNKNGAARKTETAEESDNKLQEIVVTATKRRERIQDVPMSIAVIGSQEIERRGLIGMEDYLRSIPGVNQVDEGPQTNAIIIRGLSTAPRFENGGKGPTTGTYFDETSITRAGGLGAGGIDVRPVDIERIEILRGPQGTAFGSSSIGGTLRIIPKKPELDGFSGRLAASYSDTSGLGSDNSMFQAVLNVPVIADRFAVRAVGYRYDESGYYRNIAGLDPDTIARAESLGLGDFVRGYVQDDVGRTVSTGGRLAALWQATDKLTLSLNALTQKIEQDGRPWLSRQSNGLPIPGNTAVGYEQTQFPIALQSRVRGQTNGAADTDMDLLNLVLNYDMGWADLTSVVSWIDSGSAWSTIDRASPNAPAATISLSDFESSAAEVRVASRLQGRFQFIAGLYYENVEDDRLNDIYWPGTPPANRFPIITAPVFHFLNTQEVEQRALFGEASYDLTETLTATVGARYYRYEKDVSALSEGGLINIPLGAGIPSNPDSSESDSNFKANLSYKPTESSLLYASWAEGFRLGNPQVPLSSVCDANGDGLIDGTNTSIASTNIVESDFADSYEVGGKLTLFDRRMSIDTAVYHIEWQGLQSVAVAPAPPVGCGIAYGANAGAATSTGVEFQASLLVVDGLRVDFGGGYTKAELSEDALGVGQKGARLPGSPQVSANLAVQYDFDVAGRKAFLRADSFYSGDFYGNLQESPGTRAGDYIKVDARAGVEIGSVGVELYVRNLTNEDAFTSLATFRGYLLRPRTVGVQLGYSFQ